MVFSIAEGVELIERRIARNNEARRAVQETLDNVEPSLRKLDRECNRRRFCSSPAFLERMHKAFDVFDTLTAMIERIEVENQELQHKLEVLQEVANF